MRTLCRFAAGVAVALTMSLACFGQHYKQTDLVSNTSGSALVVDPQLINAWGLSRGPGSAWWVSDQATGVSTLYNGAGEKQSLFVTIPPADPTNKNTPRDHRPVPSSTAARQIFCWPQENQQYSCSALLTERLRAGIPQ